MAGRTFDGADRLALSPAVCVVDAKPAIVFLDERSALRVECGDSRVPLLQGLARSPVLAHWLAEVPPRLAAGLVRALRDSRFLVIDGGAPPPKPAFTGNAGWLALHSGDPSQARERLRTCRVAILGVGGLGGEILRHLAGAGVGRFSLIDGDRIEPANLNRQYLYASRDVGTVKTKAAAAAIRQSYPDVDIACFDLMVQRPQDLACLNGLQPDLIVCAADTPAGRIEGIVDTYAREAGLAWIGGGVALERGHWGPVFPARGCPCHGCAAETARGQPADEAWVASLPLVRSPSSFGPSNAIVAGLMARDALVWLLRDEDPDRANETGAPHGGRRVIDLMSMTITRPAPIRCKRSNGPS